MLTTCKRILLGRGLVDPLDHQVEVLQFFRIQPGRFRRNQCPHKRAGVFESADQPPIITLVEAHRCNPSTSQHLLHALDDVTGRGADGSLECLVVLMVPTRRRLSCEE